MEISCELVWKFILLAFHLKSTFLLLLLLLMQCIFLGLICSKVAMIAFDYLLLYIILHISFGVSRLILFGFGCCRFFVMVHNLVMELWCLFSSWVLFSWCLNTEHVAFWGFLSWCSGIKHLLKCPRLGMLSTEGLTKSDLSCEFSFLL